MRLRFFPGGIRASFGIPPKFLGVPNPLSVNYDLCFIYKAKLFGKPDACFGGKNKKTSKCTLLIGRCYVAQGAARTFLPDFAWKSPIARSLLICLGPCRLKCSKEQEYCCSLFGGNAAFAPSNRAFFMNNCFFFLCNAALSPCNLIFLV